MRSNIAPDPRALLAMLHDVLAVAFAWALGFWLRFNLEIPAGYAGVMLRTLPIVMLVQAAIFWRFGLYRGIWRYASLHDLRQILIAVAISAVAAPAVLVLLRMADPVPRSVFVLDPLLLAFVMGGSRLAYRAWKEGRIGLLNTGHATPVLILGAGDMAELLVRELSANPAWSVVGLLDNSEGRQGRQIHGIPVRGRIEQVQRVAKDLKVSHVIIAMPSVLPAVRRQVVNLAAQAGLKVMTVPSFDDIVTGKVTMSQIRQVELDDLLGRDPVVMDSAVLSNFLSGKTVMVTGAGGSIGLELCRQIARFAPSQLIMFELSEFALYQAEQEFRSRHRTLPIVCAVGDTRNPRRVDTVMREYRPQVVFHAAAYKHVPLMEQVNTWEAVQNNVLGTYVLGCAAARHGVEEFVLISTDKAVNPANVMGASKRLAEMVCQALQAGATTRFVMVRFGNVLGSAGSVIPKFRQQIAEGGPLTVTHPDITRYFMSIPEAAQLVLQAGAMGLGGEIFVLDMGEPVRILDLAREMIRLSGFTENEIRIAVTGLRPGEKLYEEMLSDEEQTLPTPHPRLRIARARPVEAGWLESLLDWLDMSAIPTDEQVRTELTGWVPEYRPAEAVTMLPDTSTEQRTEQGTEQQRSEMQRDAVGGKR